MEQEVKQAIFDICSEQRPPYAYIESSVIIKHNGTEYQIERVNWNTVKFGAFVEDEDINTQLIEMIPTDITMEGCYLVRGLYPIKWDSDGYTKWNYPIEPEIVEYDFQTTIKQMEEWEKSVDTDVTNDMFNN